MRQGGRELRRLAHRLGEQIAQPATYTAAVNSPRALIRRVRFQQQPRQGLNLRVT